VTAPPGSRRSLRGRLAWSSSAIIAVWVVVVAVAANVLLGAVLVREADGALRARAEATAATVHVTGDGRVRVDDVRDDRALDAGTWILAADGTLVESPAGSTPSLDRRARVLAAQGEGAVDTGGIDPVRLLALPVTEGARTMAMVVTSTSVAPYRQVQRLALLGTIGAAVLLLVVVHLVLRITVARALRPVQQMSAQAARWSADDVDRRFGPARRPAELAELAGTLDGVLDRLSAVLRHEQRLSAELSHELRTPLARLQGEIDWITSQPRDPRAVTHSLATMDAAAGELREIVETLMTAARSGSRTAPGRCRPAEVLRRAMEERSADRPDVELVVDVPSGLVVGVDAALLVRLVGPLLDNAVRYAVARVTVTGRAVDVGVDLTVTDDGPGVPAEHRSGVFEPGRRADPADGHDGAGLGLALAHRLAVAAGGTLELREDGPGATFVVHLPAG
jgi:signal transduction histidine kinase